MDINFKGLSEFNCFLIMAAISAIFIIFALIYNTAYINYGLISFVYFYIAFFTNLFFLNALKEDKRWKVTLQFITQLILLIIWLVCLFNLYKVSLAHTVK